MCGHCGSLWVGEIGTSRNGVKHRYYKCINAKRKKGCSKKKGIKKDLLEDLVLKQILKIIMNDELIDKLADIAVEQQSKENVALPALRSNLKEINKSIDNIVKAIEDGIYTSSTKERLQALEKSREETELLIAKEEIKKPLLSKEDVVTWFCELRKLNIESLAARKCLIDIFINSIAVYENELQILFNYRDGTETVPVELLICSDIKSYFPPENRQATACLFFYFCRTLSL